ncbi:serpin B3-like isoform X2 [Paroedura picta]
MSTLTEANTKFCVDLFKALAEQDPKKNVFCSPISISAAMSMVYYGARGDTAKQMEKALCFDTISGSGKGFPVAGAQCDRPGGIHTQFKELLAAINQPTQAYELNTANRLYSAEQYEFRPEYLRCTKELYGAEQEKANFLKAAEEARKQINSWVESQTNGKIKNLFPPDTISASTILVLVNAIHFKGKWKREFNKADTKEEPFWISQNQSKNVQMMRQNGRFRWAVVQNSQIHVLELPYDQGDMSMLILLPSAKGGLDQLQKDLTYAKFKEWTCLSNVTEEWLDVRLPKFKLEEFYGLTDTLKALGMKDVFSPRQADLTGISETRDLYLSNVVHKAFVEVNEEGTEAAAATGGTIETTSAKPGFIVDQPFLFAIRHNKTESILFVGAVRNP